MKVKIKTSLSGIDFSYYAGQEVEIDDDTAKTWIENSIAEVLSGGEENDNEDNSSSTNRTGNIRGSKTTSKG